MKKTRIGFLVAVMALVVVAAVPVTGLADHATRVNSGNITALGHSPHESLSLLRTAELPPGTRPTINTDLAFWGDLAINGNWQGFRVIDISDPANPNELYYYSDCDGDQGDVLVWDRLVIRSWNSVTPDPAVSPRSCGGAPVAQGFEGLHIFDLGDSNPPTLGDVTLVETVPLHDITGTTAVEGCGSHTATLVPDEANNRLLVYNGSSNANCPFIDIVQIPLDDPTNTTLLRKEQTGRACHDIQVFLGDVNRMVCSGGNGFTMFSLDASDDASIVNPKQLYSRPVQDVTIGHSASFTWDGDVFVFGHEPGGGAQAQCQESSADVNRMAFFFDTDTGTQLGRWYLPRDQGSTENCTLHNYMMIPTQNGKDIMVSGNYQAGTWVTDITNPARPEVVAFSDPPALDPTDLGGAWATYWYNGYLYETEITKGIHVFELEDSRGDTAVTFPYLNPQTQLARVPQILTFGSQVSMRHRNDPHVFQGRVTADDQRCVGDRTVLIKKVRAGADRTVGTATTSATGFYRERHTVGGAGNYYARVTFRNFTSDIHDITCHGDNSSTLSVAR